VWKGSTDRVNQEQAAEIAACDTDGGSEYGQEPGT
jgi:hypothetical protein